MTFENIIKYTNQLNDFPKVSIETAVKYASSNIGVITGIRNFYDFHFKIKVELEFYKKVETKTLFLMSEIDDQINELLNQIICNKDVEMFLKIIKQQH